MSLKERYLQACKQIDENAEKAKRVQLNVIMQQYIKFNVGDIIEFDTARIKVERILGGQNTWRAEHCLHREKVNKEK
jgi:ASC-1-like (ASCH) protein